MNLYSKPASSFDVFDASTLVPLGRAEKNIAFCIFSFKTIIMKNNNRNKKNKNRTKKVPRTENRFRRDQDLESLHAVRIHPLLRGSSPFPPYMVRKMTFFEPNLIIQGASTAVLKEWRINSAFDPDVLLGGGTVAGYNELAKIYNQYRVEKVRVRYNVAGNEPGLPVIFGLVFRDLQPSTKLLLYGDYVNALEVAPTTGPNLVGEASGQSVFRSPWYPIHMGDIVGDRLTYLSDLSYSSSVSGNPTQLLWMALLAFSPSSSNLTNGIAVTMYIEMTVRWFSGQVVLE